MNDFLDNVINSLTETVYIFDSETGEGVRWNKALEETSGYDYEIMRHYPLAHFYPEEEHGRLEKVMRELREKGRTTIELNFIISDGNSIPTEYLFVPVTGPKGEKWICAIGRDVADRKKAEEDKLISQKRYQRLIDNAPDMIYRMSLPDGKYEYVSPAAEKITGYTPNEFYKSSTLIKKIIHPDWVDYFTEQWKKLIAGDMPPFYEYQIIHKSGEVKWLNQRNVLIRDESEKPVAIEGIVTDITGVKRTEDELRTNQETLQRAQAAARIGSWWYDPVDQQPRWTDEMYRVFGLEPQPLPPKYEEHKKIIHPDDWDRFDTAVNRSVNEGIGYNLELKVIHPNGEIGYVNSICKPELDEDGKVFGLLGTTQDITERKKIEEESARYSAEFQAIFNSITDAIVFVDTERHIVRINPGFTRIFGYTYEEVKGRTTKFFYADPEEYYQQGKVRYKRNAETDITVYEINYRRKDGSVFPSETLGVPVKDSNNEAIGFLGVIRDVTDRKKAEQEKEKLEEQLRQSQKMEAVGTLAGGIAHDFNNILTIITGNAEIAMEDIPAGNPARENIEEIRKASGRARDLVRQILAFSRKEQKERISLRPQLMIQETLKLLRSTIPTTVAIVQNISKDCSNIKADPVGLHQILMNLVTNAVHSMDEKGEVTVSLQDVNLSGDDFDQLPAMTGFSSLKTPGTYVRLSVTDKGTGMDEKTIERIFDPFYTTKEVGKGTGMGLSVVHGIVQSHGGFIDVDSEPGRGSTFYVFFPVTAEEEFFEVKKAPPQTGTERILLIDDEESLLVMGKRILDKLGYEVTAENSSEKALERFKSDPDRYDLIISDQTMPIMSGSELVAEILKVRPDIPVIICSGYSSKISEVNAKEKGISGFITKPYTKEILADAIRKVLNGKV